MLDLESASLFLCSISWVRRWPIMFSHVLSQIWKLATSCLQVVGKIWPSLTYPDLSSAMCPWAVQAAVGDIYLSRKEQPYTLGPKSLQRSLEVLHLSHLFLALRRILVTFYHLYTTF